MLAWVYNFEAAFDNSLAERDVRVIIVQQKASGGFRSAEGANVFCQARGYISTVRKNGWRGLDVLCQPYAGASY